MRPERKVCAPPGYNTRQERAALYAGLIACAVFSAGFFFRLSDAVERLYQRGPEKLLRPDALAPDFPALLGRSLWLFAVLAVLMLLFAAMRYAYFYRDSRSVYLMRRLPDAWEMHRLCWREPLRRAVICLAAGIVLKLLYFGVYLLAVPGQCLPPDQWQKVWSVLL